MLHNIYMNIMIDSSRGPLTTVHIPLLHRAASRALEYRQVSIYKLQLQH